jgi:hypothetical protein
MVIGFAVALLPIIMAMYVDVERARHSNRDIYLEQVAPQEEPFESPLKNDLPRR